MTALRCFNLRLASATAWAMAGLTLVSLCIGIAAIAGFFAHEPLLVAFGHRGRRAQRATPKAKPRFAMMLVVTLISGMVALVLAAWPVRVALLGTLALAASGFGLAIGGRHRSVWTQLWGVVGLSAPTVPILLAGGFDFVEALSASSVWLIGFAATTMAVHAVIAVQKRRSRSLYAVALAIVCLGVTVAIALGGEALLATVPMILIS